MKDFNQFTKQYSLPKTICFDLEPVNETKSFLEERLIVQDDNVRAENATKVKEYMDRYHKVFIESVLSGITLSNLEEYISLYFKEEKTDEEKNAFLDVDVSLREEIANTFTNHPDYKKIFGKEMVTEFLPSFLSDEEEKAIVASFNKFTVYFTDFYKTRQTIYENIDAPTSVASRCITDNLPKFLNNARIFGKIKDILPADYINQLSADMHKFIGSSAENAFDPHSFNNVLTQTGIEIYNTVVGGYTNADGIKIKGINEYINQYNQTLSKNEKKLPLMVPLFKQILSEREIISFIAEKFNTDDEVFSAILEFYNPENPDALSLPDAMNRLKTLFSNIAAYDPKGIFVTSKYVTDLSVSTLGKWGAIEQSWYEEYDEKEDSKNTKRTEKYFDKRKKAFGAIKSFSLNDLQRLGERAGVMRKSVVNYFAESVISGIIATTTAFEVAEPILTKETSSGKKLFHDEDAIGKIKAFLDSAKMIEHAIKPLVGTGKEENRDATFYGELIPLVTKISEIARLYDRVRNYMTQKPYSKDKVKLTFGSSTFFNGWSQDFSSKGAHIIFKDGQYYLMIVDKKLSVDDTNLLFNDGNDDTAILYGYHFLKPDNKMVPKMFINSGGGKFPPVVAKHNLPIYDILDLYQKKMFTTEYAKIDPAAQKEALAKLIDYFKLGISVHDSFSKFNIRLKPTEEYNNIAEFYSDLERTCYRLTEEKVGFNSVLNLVKEGKVYLFRFANKDFSPCSKGTPNLHTLYFKALFDKDNLDNPVYKLSGGAEMYFRKASISKEDAVVHHAHYPIGNKNPNTKNRKSVFDYDIIKDRRFTLDRFKIHIPILLNFGVDEADKILNKRVRTAIHNSDETYVIGIDRGEKNLLFATVIDSKGTVVEQRSLNVINGIDYHEILERKAKERQDARQAFMPIKNIKENKKGYMDQAVNVVCELVMKYNAIIAIEDLDDNFKNNRKKIEKEIYQTFERQLINKLKYLVFKKQDKNAPGGLFNAYQLTSDTEMRGQNGIIFYVPAQYTSRTCPATGFVNLFGLKYTNIRNAKDFFNRFNSIRYNEKANLFEFNFNYSAFDIRVTDHTDKWTVHSYGDRIHTFKDEKHNNEWTYKKVVLTTEFKKLFDDFGADYRSDIKQVINERTEKEFFERLITLFNLTLQIRNSYAGDDDADYVISPCKDAKGKFYDSRNYIGNENAPLPASADANDAYNVARKGLWAIKVLKDIPEDQTAKVKLSISNKDWLRFAQTGEI